MNIVFTNTKGGSGKSTSAILLAAAWTMLGQKTTVVDADPQGSALDWAEQAQAVGREFPFAVEPYSPSILHDLRVAGGHVMVDTPPGSAEIITSVVREADLVVIPTQASSMDLSRAWRTYRGVMEMGKPPIILLTQVDKRTTLYTESVKAISEAGAYCFDTPIRRRQAFRNAAALGGLPTDGELRDYFDVVHEITRMIEG